MSDMRFRWAAIYAAKGWHIVPCHGSNGEKCTCRSENCSTPGKHPVLNAWQHKSMTDEDELSHWYDGVKNYNIGVQLGEKSGIIDIEFDTDQGRKTAERFGIDKAYTPTFTSKRSTHRLFKWDRRLPQQAVYKLAGLEIRIGGGKRGAQSIFPPSSHSSGASYSWVEGMSCEDCEVAEIPKELLVAIINEVGEKSGGGEAVERKPSANKILYTPMGEGDRHDSLVRFAARQCINMLNVHDAVEQQDVLELIKAMNKQRCNPPKGDDEIENIFRHELSWATRKRAQGVADEVEKSKAVADRMENGVEQPTEGEDKSLPFTTIGLRYDGEEWWPGQWHLKVIHGDPVSYALTVPVFREVNSEQKTVRVSVPLNAESFRSAAKVAQAILEATHTVIVDAVPEEWFGIWNGQGKKKGQKAVRGLKAKLMDEASQEAATAENCRFATVAGWLLEVLSMSPKPDDDADEDGSPDVTGMPAWVRGRDGVWELWFGWMKAWEMVDRGRRKLEDGDIKTIKKMILAAVGQNALPASRGAGEGGSSRRFIRFTAAHLRALESLAAGEFGAESVTAFSIHEEVDFEIEKK
jgi:hypothetical protein